MAKNALSRCMLTTPLHARAQHTHADYDLQKHPRRSPCSAAQAEELHGLEGLPPGLQLEAESGSQHLFLCERPARLVVPQPIRGQHKVWPLPAATARQFAPALKRVPPVRHHACKDSAHCGC